MSNEGVDGLPPIFIPTGKTTQTPLYRFGNKDMEFSFARGNVTVGALPALSGVLEAPAFWGQIPAGTLNVCIVLSMLI